MNSPYLAQFVKNTYAKKFQDIQPDAADAIINSHYVDDFIRSTDTVEDAVQLIKDVIDIQDKARFELHNFSSNSKKVLESLPKNPVADCKLLQMDEKISEQRILEMMWDTLSDTITFSMNFNKLDNAIVEIKKILTKREVWKIIILIYDPIGFLSPITVK